MKTKLVSLLAILYSLAAILLDLHAAPTDIDYKIDEGQLLLENYRINAHVDPNRISSDEEFIRFNESPDSRYLLVEVLRFSDSEYWIIDRTHVYPLRKIPVSTGLSVEILWHGDILEIQWLGHISSISFLIPTSSVNDWVKILNLIYYSDALDLYISSTDLKRVELGHVFKESEYGKVSVKWDAQAPSLDSAEIVGIRVSNESVSLEFSIHGEIQSLSFPIIH